MEFASNTEDQVGIVSTGSYDARVAALIQEIGHKNSRHFIISKEKIRKMRTSRGFCMKNTKPCEAANIIAKICVENGCNVQSPHSPHNVRVSHPDGLVIICSIFIVEDGDSWRILVDIISGGGGVKTQRFITELCQWIYEQDLICSDTREWIMKNGLDREEFSRLYDYIQK